jgi:hypothetical protein
MRPGPLVAAVLAALLAVPTARAIDEPPTTSGRTVNGHVFMPSPLIPPPVPTTSFAVGMLLGTGGATGPKYDINGNPTGETIDYTYAALGQTLSYEFTFLKNFTGRLGLLTTLYAGLDGPSVLVVGATVRVGGSAGITWSLPLGDVFRLGASIDLDYSPQLNLLVGAAVLAALQGNFDPSLAFQQDNVFTWKPAVTFSWAPMSALGFTGQLGYSTSSLNLNSGTVSREAVTLGVLGEVDFGKFTPVAIGLGLVYRQNIGVNSSQSQQANIRDIGGAILYTGKPEVSLGLQMLSRKLTIRPQLPDPLETTFPIAEIFVRYFWL